MLNKSDIFGRTSSFKILRMMMCVFSNKIQVKMFSNPGNFVNWYFYDLNFTSATHSRVISVCPYLQD